MVAMLRRWVAKDTVPEGLDEDGLKAWHHERFQRSATTAGAVDRERSRLRTVGGCGCDAQRTITHIPGLITYAVCAVGKPFC